MCQLRTRHLSTLHGPDTAFACLRRQCVLRWLPIEHAQSHKCTRDIHPACPVHACTTERTLDFVPSSCHVLAQRVLMRIAGYLPCKDVCDGMTLYVCTPSPRAAVSLVVMWKLSLGMRRVQPAVFLSCFAEPLMMWQTDWMLQMVWHILCLLHGTTQLAVTQLVRLSFRLCCSTSRVLSTA